MARLLLDRGYRPVRPLEGGLEAWIEAGYDVEPDRDASSGTAATGAW